MTSKKRDFFEAQGYRNIGKRVLIALLVLVVVVVTFVGYYFYSSVKVCSDYQCFLDGLEGCDKVSFVRDDLKASWYYEIVGDGGVGCNVEVMLLSINEGSVENRVFEGKSMVCGFVWTGGYPEDDLFSCSGVLREEMQEKIIQDMHSYLLENIGEIKEEFRGV
ncbi:hypothetical protein HOE04_03890 [archaeon]|jgi:hypothetical protein|nr:hypothetical protein [archaeon]